MNSLNKVVFLDRDGVINVDVNYLDRVESIKLIDGTKTAIKKLKEDGYKVLVVTNQSGVSRGYFDLDQLNKIHYELNKLLDNMIDDFYFCPHLPTDNCFCRKPNIGMFREANTKHNIDFKNSFMVGDKAIDVLAGYNAGLKTIAVKTGYGEMSKRADYYADNLLDAVRTIICK